MKPARLLLIIWTVLLGSVLFPANARNRGEALSEADPVDPTDQINLLFIGNSITAGATLSSASTQAPPIVCGQLVEEVTGITTNVYNGGHSGITTWGFLPGRTDFTKVVNAAKAYKESNGGKIFFSIMLGTNDSACTTTEGAPVSTSTYRENIKKIIDELIAQVPDCKILLNYPIWYSPNTHNGAMYLQEGLDRLRSYYPILDAIIEEYDQVFAGNRGVWEYFEDNKVLFTKEAGNSGDFFLHPNVYGAKRLAEIWANSLLEIMKADGIDIKNPLPEWNVFKPSNNKKYTISTPRGLYGTKNGILTNTAKTGIGATEGEFAILTYKDQTYLYSVADKKFAYRDPVPYKEDWSNILLSDEMMIPVKIHYTGVKEAYPYCLTMEGYIANSASGTSTNYGVVVNTWNSATDGGNQTAFVEVGDFDPTEALATLDDYFSKQVNVTYRIVDSEGHFLDEITSIGQEGDVLNVVPDRVPRKAYTTYTVKEPVTLAKDADNIVNVIATWSLPFELSPDINNAHWYNLALRDSANYVNADEGYKCNPFPTKQDVNSAAYQWAFQGNPYDGIIVYNRSDITKTLAKVYSEEKQNDVAVLSDGIFKWRIVESQKGFLLAADGSYPYINEYGGSGGHLGFWGSLTDVGSIFSVCEVGVLAVENVKLPSGAVIRLFTSDEEKSNGRGILIIPGGGYGYVAGSSEGADWAPFFNDFGYTAAVLTYTTPPTAPDGPLTQARDAMRYLRENAEELYTTTGQIGVIGFSAGGHLASTVATHLTGDELPVFQILFYPVITMGTGTHAGSRDNLLGKNPSKELIDLYSNEKQVTAETPRAYLCWATNDATVPPASNVSKYQTALRKAKVPYKAKSFSTGGHGFGFKTDFTYHNAMVKDLTKWMQDVEEILDNVSAPKEASASTALSKACYNLAGIPVSKPHHGLFITSDKAKVIIP